MSEDQLTTLARAVSAAIDTLGELRVAERENRRLKQAEYHLINAENELVKYRAALKAAQIAGGRR